MLFKLDSFCYSDICSTIVCSFQSTTMELLLEARTAMLHVELNMLQTYQLLKEAQQVPASAPAYLQEAQALLRESQVVLVEAQQVMINATCRISAEGRAFPQVVEHAHIVEDQAVTIDGQAARIGESFSVADNQHSNHQISESGTENSSSSSSGVGAESVDADSFDTIPVIAYPAPIPKFSTLILSALTAGLKVSVMSVYSELIKECASFYSPICSTEISKARKSLENIGKTLTEKFPVLVTSDGAKPWSFFNSRLSVALRNKRNRIAGKLTSASALPISAKYAAPVAKCSASFSSTSATVQASKLGTMKLTKPLTTDEYEEHVGKLKTDFSRQDHDLVLMKELLALTHRKRREWIDSSKSTDLRLSTIVKKFPCFTGTVFLRYELALLVGQEKVDKFIGKWHVLICLM